MSEPHYDVFLSYAHADAYTEEQKKIVVAIKNAIEEAMKSVAGNDSCVFLDSEALKWGDEWGAKIQDCISHARVFVYLLSPNYLKSSYCQREKLWWARHEIRRGRLNRETRPVYYIELPETGDEATDHDIRELMICQWDNKVFTDSKDGYGKPFFASLDEVRSDIVVSRLAAIQESVMQQYQQSGQSESLCTVKPPISRYFVGRLKELADLNQLCHEEGAIPVISGEAGVGKSELAVAYAYAYAERFPQGRFLIPMEGIFSWTAAVVKMVENIRTTLTGDLASIGLPEDFDRLDDEKKCDAVYLWLKTRSDQGELLLLLDNLEDLELISEDSLLGLTHQNGLPTNVRIIATTRLKEQSASSWDDRKFFELGRLSDKDAFELFCLIGDNCFPFAKWPLSESGELILDKLPEEKRPDERECAVVKKEYAAVKEIISLLAGHAWSLEIVAGFMKNNRTWTFESKLAELKKDLGAGIIGKTHRSEILQDPEKLLKPTLEQLLKFNDIDEKLGDHILFLAQAASFFPPEQVPRYALEGIWKQEFGDQLISWEGGMRKANSCALAMEQLKRYRIVNGDGEILKMHRLNREVLRAKAKSETIVRNILEIMREYLERFLSETSNPSAQQLCPWCGWIHEAAAALPSMQQDETFFATAASLVGECIPIDLLDEAEQILDCFKEIKEESAIARRYALLGTIHDDVSRCEEAEQEFKEALVSYRKLAETEPRYRSSAAMTLNNLAGLHANLNRYEEAEQEFKDTLAIRREQEKSNPGKYQSDVAKSLNNLAILHADLNRYDEAEQEYKEALTIRRELTKTDPEMFNPDVANTLNDLADLHSDLNHYKEAEQEYKEALSIRKELAKINPEKYNRDTAETLNNLAVLHYFLDRYDEAEQEYEEALSIRKELAKINPEKYNRDTAETLNNLAILHENLKHHEAAEQEYKEALAIRRELAKNAPEFYNPDVAETLNNLAVLHEDLKHYEAAEQEYKEALAIRRELAKRTPERYLSGVAKTLNNLAILHYILDLYDKTEQEFEEALSIRKELAKMTPERFLPDVADTLNNLAVLHKNLNRFAEAEQEYKAALAIRRDLAKSYPEKYEPEIAKVLTRLAELHSPSGSVLRRITGILFSRQVRAWAKMAKAERTEALAIAEKYPDDPACKIILEQLK